MAKTQISYTEAMKQLEDIVQHMQNPECDIDNLRNYTQKGLELLQVCKQRLKETDADVKKIIAQIEADELA